MIQPNASRFKQLLLLFFACFFSLSSFAQDDTVRVMYYNLLEFPTNANIPSREDTLANIIQHVQPDILIVCELNAASGATAILNDALNINGQTNWQSATFVSNTSSPFDQLSNMMFYRSDKVTLYEEDIIQTDLRDINKYTVYMNDPDLATNNDTVFLDLFGLHLKANQGSANEMRRADAIDSLIQYIELEGTSGNRIVGGDFNFYNSNEDGNQALLSATYPFNDPINMQGVWNNNPGFAGIHTQSTRDTTLASSGSSGGLDDRFDQILTSNSVLLGTQNISYINGSYTAVGNDGNHFNQAINDGVNTSAPSDVINSLYYMSDHLPVILDLNINYPDSLDPPVAVEAYFQDSVTAVVLFNEAVNATAQTTGNYSLSPSINISSAIRSASQDSVFLTLSSPITECVTYTLTVSNVQDVLGIPMAAPVNLDIEDCNIIPTLVISEIMFNDAGSGNDALEFIEVFNNTSDTVNLLGYAFSGVNFSFPDTNLYPGAYIVSAVNPDSFNTIFGFRPYGWTSGGLSNGGETILLLDNMGMTVDSVPFDDSGDWPDADGTGPSLVLCNPFLDNSFGVSWELSTNALGTYAGLNLFASPGSNDVCGADLNPPTVLSVTATSLTTISVTFSEAVDSTAEIPSNYAITQGVSNASRNASLNIITLTLANPLTPGQSESITISGVADLAGNAMAAGQTFSILINASSNDIVITEIMYNDPGSGTDALEFLEFYNGGLSSVNLQNYSLVGVNYTFPDTILTPGALMVVAVNADSFNTVFGFTPLEWSSGALSNSGETLLLLDDMGNTVDSVRFDDGGGWPNEADGAGPSLILCDPKTDNALAANWDTAAAFVTVYAGLNLYASPGDLNACGPDTTRPLVDGVIVLNNTTVLIDFSEQVSPTAEVTGNYSVSTGVSSALRTTNNDSVTLTLATPLTLGVPVTLTISNIADLSGNPMAASQMFTLVLYQTIGDVVITEIMYNDPGSGIDALEFVEIYNNDSQTLQLRNYQLEGIEYTFPDTILTPGSYMVLAANADSFATVFGFTPLDWGGGGLSNSGELVRLFAADSTVIDSVPYDDSGAWPTAPDGNGPSLVLCNPNADNALGSNWSASNTAAGIYQSVNLFASPGQDDASCNLTIPFCIPDGYEPNDSIPDAKNLFGGAIAIFGDAFICPQGDEDIYYFKVNSSGKIAQISLGCLPANYELEVISGGQIVAASANSGTSDENIQLAVNPGTYYVRVYGNNGAFSGNEPYCLTVNLTTVASGSGTTKPPIVVTPPPPPPAGSSSVKPGISSQIFKSQRVETESLSVFPNPFNQSITARLTINRSTSAEIKISDALGRVSFMNKKELEKGVNEFALDLHHLPSGMYFISIQTEGVIHTKSLIKN